MADTPPTTQRGTPYSKKWDTAWREKLNTLEDELNRPCCGAHAPDGSPCELGSSQKNGRCRFHGGVDDIGAPVGNTNARIHGLYARRLQQCGDHCPMWETCPMVGADILKLDPKKRPICPYEQEEFELLHELDQKSDPGDKTLQPYTSMPDPHPHQAHIVSLQENLNLMQIMITRTANAVRAMGATQDLSVTSDNYNLSTHKTSAALQAFQILTREYRCTLNTLHRIIDRFKLPRTWHKPEAEPAVKPEGPTTLNPPRSKPKKRPSQFEHLPEPFRSLAESQRRKPKPT